MKKEEYLDKLKIFASEYEAKKREAMREYCLSNNTVKIGDIVEDHMGAVEVVRIIVTSNFGDPCCVYHGFELKKDYSRKKSGVIRDAYQPNVKRIISK